MDGVKSSPGYGASKGGIHALTKYVAVAGSPDIYSNAVAPGSTKTNLTKEQDMSEDVSLLERIGEPKDIAEAVAFLASQA